MQIPHTNGVFFYIYSVGCVIIIIIFIFFSLQLNDSVRKLFHLLTRSYVTCAKLLWHIAVLPPINRINLSKGTHFPRICKREKNTEAFFLILLFLLLHLIFVSSFLHLLLIDPFSSLYGYNVQGFYIFFPVQLRAHEISIWVQFIFKWHIVIVDCTSTVSKQTRLFLIKQPIFSFCCKKKNSTLVQTTHVFFFLVLSLFLFLFIKHECDEIKNDSAMYKKNSHTSKNIQTEGEKIWKQV